MLPIVLSVAALLLVAVGILLVLFEPGLPYSVVGGSLPSDPGRALDLVGVLVDSNVHASHSIEVLTNGDSFYAAELEAISKARASVHIEAFIFHRSSIADRFLAALIDCARRGVHVRVVVDAIGSFPTPNSYFGELRRAGGQVAWYQPIRWYTLKRFNNRSHRELVIVDGIVGFIGGAGISAHWSEPDDGHPPWRDTMVRVDGPVVAGLQTAFLENWLEATGEILTGSDSFPELEPPAAGAPGLVVVSAPSPARASRARVLFQVLLASAREAVDINSPYFLPDRSVRRELVAAAARGVRVRVVVPGVHNNHPWARRASRRTYGELLSAGIEVYEYQPGMIHAKIMIVDALWSVVGSTNFDSRSFELNDEVNLAVVDQALAQRLGDDFLVDLHRSQNVTLAVWNARPWHERLLAYAGAAFERQE